MTPGMQRLLRIIAVVPLWFLAAEPVRGESSAIGAELCNGFDPRTGRFGELELGKDRERTCPDGYAIFGTGDVSGRITEPVGVRIKGSCCKLPDGALLGEHRYEAARCPDGFIATGVKRAQTNPIYGELLRCSRVNPELYILGPLTHGMRLGDIGELYSDLVALYLENGIVVRRASRSSLPIALRYGLFRQSFGDWAAAGCFGYPFGSPLVGKEHKRCFGMSFRELIPRPGSGASPIIPPCLRADDLYAPVTRCAE